MRPTLRAKSSAVVRAWDAFLKDPATSLPSVAAAISELRAFLEAEDKDAEDRNQLKLF